MGVPLGTPKILVVHKFSKLNLERDRAQSARRCDQFQAQLSRSRASELVFALEGSFSSPPAIPSSLFLHHGEL